jgi:hypothetical protein
MFDRRKSRAVSTRGRLNDEYAITLKCEGTDDKVWNRLVVINLHKPLL